MTKWDFIKHVFERLFGFSNEFGSVNAKLDRLTTNQETQMSDLQSVKAALESNTATIAEIAGDVQELKTSNDALTAKVDELTKQLPDNALVGEIAALVAAQATSLRSIADVVPEPEAPPAV